MDSIICEKCQREVHVGDWPHCPHSAGANSAHGDDIPGGMWIRHGICNEDGTPRRYDSYSAMRAEAKRRNVVNSVQHLPVPNSGSDKSKFTTRWVGMPTITEEERIRHWREHEEQLTRGE